MSNCEKCGDTGEYEDTELMWHICSCLAGLKKRFPKAVVFKEESLMKSDHAFILWAIKEYGADESGLLNANKIEGTLIFLPDKKEQKDE